MRDMITPAPGRGERSIRNIPLSGSHRHRHGHEQDETPEEPFGEAPPRLRRRRKGRRPFLLLAFGVVVLCALGALLLSTVFAGASIKVYPQTKEVEPPPTMQARLSAPLGTLAYENTTLRRTASGTVLASGSTKVSRQASGVITVYNTFGEVSQRLIANTRFEAPDGKIYRIRDSVTVPGMTKATNGALVPGSVSVTVYADSPGEDYNKEGSVRFTIPGFKGDPRYEKFYALSQGGMTGGFVGTEPSVPPAELAKAEAALKLELDTAIRTAASSEIPEGYLPVEGSLSIAYGDIRRTPKGNEAELTQSAIATIAVVREGDLAAALAEEELGGEYGGEAVIFLDPSALSITLATSSVEGVISLSLKGSPVLLWQFDPALLRDALLGKKRDELEGIIKSFEPAVARADATIKPFWQKSFPSNPQKIKIEVVSPEKPR